MAEPRQNVTLRRKLDQVLAKSEGCEEEKPVKILWARPISGRGKEISVLGLDKTEVALIGSLAELDPDSRRIAEEELERRYLMPHITRVIRAEANYGNRYWDVETDRGKRNFVMKDPSVNVTWLTDDHLVIKDALGNRYEIESLSALDTASQAFVQRVV